MFRVNKNDSQERQQVSVRLSPKLKAWLAAEAEANGRSLGAEVGQMVRARMAEAEAEQPKKKAG
jgi:hypothetical protein